MSDNGPPSRRRGVINHWVPLVVTLTVATVGVAAWVWSQRSRDDDYEDEEGEQGGGYSSSGPGRPGLPQRPFTDVDYDHADYGDNPAYGVSTPQPRDAGGSTVGNTISMTEAASAVGSSGGWSARLGALGGSSSPQEWVGSASKAVSAGITAASAAVGGALASIREGDKDAYADHETWSEEAEARRGRAAPRGAAGASAGASSGAAAGTGTGTVAVSSYPAGGKRKTVVIVVSADHYVDVDADGFHEHASILSYIPRQNDFSRTRIFVLVYAPHYKESSATLDPNSFSTSQQANSLSSSFSNIATEAAQSPKQEAKSVPSSDIGYSALYAQALALVQKESEIIPFTTPNGHANILHLLEPDVVYLQESLSGENGATVNQLQNWIRNDIVVVVGAESGYGGLADSESEAEKPAAGAGADVTPKWWQREDRVGRGRGVVVVDGMRVHDDWVRRVQGKD